MNNIKQKNNYILGISGFYHDAAACLIKDGKIVAASEEERFNRIKHSTGLPTKAIRYCLETAGINFSQIDCIGYYLEPWKIVFQELREVLLFRRSFFNVRL